MLSAEVAAAVAGDFATLALLHDAELTPAIVAGLRDVGFPANLALVPSGELALGSCEMIRSALVAAPNEAGAAWYDECAADYAAIYLTGAFGVAPSESFWLTDDHLVCQQPMFDLRALYAADGLVAPDWRRRPDDHLVHELQYIAHRLGRSSSDEDWRRLGEFLDYHLLRWLPDFSARIADRCGTLFYAALAMMTQGWARQLRELIAAHLGEPVPTAEEISARLDSRRVADVPEFPVRFLPGATGPSW